MSCASRALSSGAVTAAADHAEGEQRKVETEVWWEGGMRWKHREIKSCSCTNISLTQKQIYFLWMLMLMSELLSKGRRKRSPSLQSQLRMMERRVEPRTGRQSIIALTHRDGHIQAIKCPQLTSRHGVGLWEETTEHFSLSY